jgi:hypothetical protein
MASGLTERGGQHNEERKQLEQELAMVDAEQPPQVLIAIDEARELAEFLVDAIKSAETLARALFTFFIEQIVIQAELVEIYYDPQKLLNRPEGPVHSRVKWLPGTGSNRRPSD